MKNHNIKFDEEFAVLAFDERYVCKINGSHRLLYRLIDNFCFDGYILSAVMSGNCKIEKLPFIPSVGETYYFIKARLSIYEPIALIPLCAVESTTRRDNDMMVRVGNCFRTHQDAVDAIDKITQGDIENSLKGLFNHESR